MADLSWRRPVLAHDALLTFPFKAALLEGDLARGLAKLLQDENWSHWLSGLADQSITASDARTELNQIYDASRDFLNDIRKIVYPELTVALPRGVSNPDDVEIVRKRIADRLRRLEQGDFGSSVLRLRYLGDAVGQELHVRVGVNRYIARIDFLDVCVFPDAHASLVIRLADLRKHDGTVLDSFELGSTIRRLKRIQFRARTRVDVPVFVSADGTEYDWIRIVAPVIEQLAGPFAEIVAESAAAAFRVLSVTSIARDSTLHSTGCGPFADARERLHFELATGHDTSDTQELPSAERVQQIRSTGLVRQWETFDALVFWDDVTLLIEDRTGSDELPEGQIDTYARVEYPSRTLYDFLLLVVVANYQEAKLLEFIHRLLTLASSELRDPDEPHEIADQYVRFRSTYWHRGITPSQTGKALHLAIVKMMELDDLAVAVGEQLERAKSHYQSQLALQAEKANRATQFAVTALGLIGIPLGIITAILQTQLGNAKFVHDLGAEGSWWTLAASFACLTLLAGWLWAVEGILRRRRWRKSSLVDEEY